MKRKVLSVLCLSFMMIMCLTGCGNKSEEKRNNIKYNINADENIVVKPYISFDNRNLIVDIINNNSYGILYLDIDCIYYDENGNVIGKTDTSLSNVPNNGNVITDLYLEDDNYKTISPATIDIEVRIEKDWQSYLDEYKMYNDKISTSYNVSDDKVEVTLKNDADVDVKEINALVVFMKKSNPIYIEEYSNYGGINKGMTEKFEVDIPDYYDETKDDDIIIDYDSIKIVINSAINKY